MSHGCSRASTERTILEVKGHFHFSMFNTVDPLSERLSLIIRNLFPNPGTLTKKISLNALEGVNGENFA